MKTVDVLKKARKLLGDPARFNGAHLYSDAAGHVVFQSKKAEKFSLDGGLVHVSGDRMPYYAYRALGFDNDLQLWDWEETATHAEVLARLDAAIAKEEAAHA